MMHWIILIGLFATLGCSSLIKNVPQANIIMVDVDGQPVDPTGNVPCEVDTNGNCFKRHSMLRGYPPFESLGAYRTHITGVMTGLEKHKNDGKPHKIIIHAHGGLNFQTGTVERAAELHQDILNDTGAYPIFINWQSSLFPSYWNHLTHIRQGEDWSTGGSSWWAFATAPFYFAADVVRAAIRIPTATFLQVRNDLETVPHLRFLHSRELVLAQEVTFDELCRRKKNGENWASNPLKEYARTLDRHVEDCERVYGFSQHDLSGLNIWLGLDERTLADKVEASIKYVITSPTKLASAPIIDALGTSSWDVMLRSVAQLFHYDGVLGEQADINTSRDLAYDFRQTGALSVFFDRLRAQICESEKGAEIVEDSRDAKCANKDNWEITLVGHSTGAIIVNRIIRDFGDLPIKNVVYMAAASTIKDYQDTIFPYLKRRNAEGPLHEAAQLCRTSGEPVQSAIPEWSGVCVYHLMLHEAAESGEWWSEIIDPWPRGSLLVWLDNFLSHPLSREDRMLGRFTNFIGAAHHTPEPLRPYVNIVKFGVGEGELSPQKHGEFGGKLKYWKPECWGAPADNPRNCYRALGHY